MDENNSINIDEEKLQEFANIIKDFFANLLDNVNEFFLTTKDNLVEFYNNLVETGQIETVKHAFEVFILFLIIRAVFFSLKESFFKKRSEDDIDSHEKINNALTQQIKDNRQAKKDAKKSKKQDKKDAKQAEKQDKKDTRKAEKQDAKDARKAEKQAEKQAEKANTKATNDDN